MELLKLTDTDKPRYTDFVSTRNGSFLQSWDWGEWQKQIGKIPHRFFVQADNGIMLAAQVLEQTVPRFGWKYLYIPYGPAFVDHIANDKNDGIIRTLLDGLKQQFPEAIFIRLEPTDDLQLTTYNLQLTKHIQPGKTLVLDLKQSEEQLLAAMHHKTRYNIKLANKHGVQVTRGGDVIEAIKMIGETAKRQGYKSQDDNYFLGMLKFFEGRSVKAQIYQAHFNNILLAASLIIDHGPTRTYLFGGTSEFEKQVMAPYAMHWKAILDAQADGFTAYDFWGIETASGATPGFVRFKLGFGGQQVSYPPAIDLVNRPALYSIYKFLRMLV